MAPEVRIFRDLHEVEPDLWNSLLAPADLQLTHRFVVSCQDSGIEDARYWHLTIFEGGMLQCIATLSRMTVSLDLLSGNVIRTAIRKLRRFKTRFMQVPVLFCGLPVSFGQPGLRLRSGARVPTIMAAIASQMEMIARQHDIPLLCFKDLDPKLAAEADVLGSCGYFQAPSLPACSLSLRWDSFEQYISCMRAGYRRQARRTLHHREELGVQVRVVEDFSDHLEAIYSLYSQVMDRAPHQLERLNQAFFGELNRNLGTQAPAIILESEGRVLAAAILLTTPGHMTFLLAGIDYSLNQKYQSYHVLVLEVVAQAIRSGAKCLEMGQTSYALKSRLGGCPVPRYLYLRHRTTLNHRLLQRASGWLFPTVDVPRRRVFKGEREDP